MKGLLDFNQHHTAERFGRDCLIAGIGRVGISNIERSYGKRPEITDRQSDAFRRVGGAMDIVGRGASGLLFDVVIRNKKMDASQIELLTRALKKLVPFYETSDGLRRRRLTVSPSLIGSMVLNRGF